MITISVGAQLRRPGRRGAQRCCSRFSRVSQGTAAFPPLVLYPEGEESIRLHRSGTGEPLLATGGMAGHSAQDALLQAVWPVIQRKMLWLAKILVALMRANAQMLLSRARRHGTINPAHADRVHCSHLGATALRHSACRTTASTTAAASARTNVPAASRPTLSIGREHSCGLRSL